MKAVVQKVRLHPLVVVTTPLGGYACYVGHIAELNLEPGAQFVLWYPGSFVVQTSSVCRTARPGATGSQGAVWDGAVL